MRAPGFKKQWQSWRWAPCAALIGGAICFIGFAVFAIPDRIGSKGAPSSRSVLGAALARAASGDSMPAGFTDSATVETERLGKSTPEPLHIVRQPATADLSNGSFPKRGFTPPLDRPEPPPAPEPAPVQLVPPQAVEVAPPPLQAPPIPAPEAPAPAEPAPATTAPAPVDGDTARAGPIGGFVPGRD